VGEERVESVFNISICLLQGISGKRSGTGEEIAGKMNSGCAGNRRKDLLKR
jgi:hypothetical protein